MKNQENHSNLIQEKQNLEYIRLRKIAIGYWDITSYCFLFCCFYKYSDRFKSSGIYKFAFSSILALWVSVITLKPVLLLFNKEDYKRFLFYYKKRALRSPLGIRDFFIL